MMQEAPTERCEAPALRQYLTPYCFGDATDAEREAFAAHLIDCDECWREVQELQAAIAVIREDTALVEPMVAGDVISVLGTSAKLDAPFAGHLLHVVFSSAAYAALCPLALFAEIAFEFDRYGAEALRIAPIIMMVMFGTSVAGFGLDWWRTRSGRVDGLIWSVIVFLVGAAACFGIGRTILPATSIVLADFQTYTAQAGFLKSFVQTLPMAVLLMVVPFHFVVTMQRELKSGRHRAVRDILMGEARAIVPAGSVFIGVRMLSGVVACAGVIGLYMLSHLLESLEPARYANLFTLVAEARAVLYFTVAGECLLWYYWRLNELKREARALTELPSSRSQDN